MFNNCLRLVIVVATLGLAGCGAGIQQGGELLQPQKIYFEQPGPLIYPWGTEFVYDEEDKTKKLPLKNSASGGEGKGDIVYSSSDESVVQVDSAGKLTLLAPGRVEITATKEADERYASAEVSYTVYVTRRNRELVFRYPDEIILYANQNTFANPIVEPYVSSVEYESSDESIAKVDPGTGLVTIVSTGKVLISASVDPDELYSPGYAEYTLWVKRLPQSISFQNPGPLDAKAGQATFINQAVDGAGTGAIYYASSNPAVATVDPVAGEVTPLSRGTCVITATKASDDLYASATAQYELNVKPADPRIVFEKAGDQHAFVDEQFHNLATSNYGTEPLVYESSDPTIASVDESTGVVTPKAAGQVTITATQTNNDLTLSAEYNLNIAGSYIVRAMLWNSADDATLEFREKDVLDNLVPLGLNLYQSYKSSGCLTGFQSPSCFNAPVPILIDSTSFSLSNVKLSVNRQFQLSYGDPDSGERFSTVLESNEFLPPMESVRVVTFDNKLWRLGGETSPGLWMSIDGVNWEKVDPKTDPASKSQREISIEVIGQILSFNNTLWLIYSELDLSRSESDPNRYKLNVWASIDGVNWVDKESTLYIPGNVKDAAFYAVNQKLWLKLERKLWSSYNGVSWAPETIPYTTSPPKSNRITKIENRVWAWDTDLRNSVDGIFWKTVAVPQGVSHVVSMAGFNGKIWLLADGKLYNSTDGENFEEVLDTPSLQNDTGSPTNSETTKPFVPELEHAEMLAFKGRLWLIGGVYSNDIWSSADGIEWRLEHGMSSYQATSEQKNRLHVVEFDGKLFAASGDKVWCMKNDATTNDYLSWKYLGKSPETARGDVDLVVFNNGLWKSKVVEVISDTGTQFNTKLFLAVNTSCSDKFTWSEQQAVFDGELSHLVVFNQGLYVYPRNYKQDAKAYLYADSGDGSFAWSTVKLNVNFTSDLAINSMAVGAGEIYALNSKKLLKSNDGQYWTDVDISNLFNSPPIEFSLSTVHWIDNRLWVTGSRDSNGFITSKEENGWYEKEQSFDLPANDAAMISYKSYVWLFGGHVPALSADNSLPTLNNSPWRTSIDSNYKNWYRGQPLYFRFVE